MSRDRIRVSKTRFSRRLSDPSSSSEDDTFADFIVHEVAHIFHNCKRATIGFRETRTKVWLLNIEYRKRGTFAYSCEAYAQILERGMNSLERRALAEEYGTEARIPDEGVDPTESRVSSRKRRRRVTAGK
jgi:hypothetical protein